MSSQFKNTNYVWFSKRIEEIETLCSVCWMLFSWKFYTNMPFIMLLTQLSTCFLLTQLSALFVYKLHFWLGFWASKLEFSDKFRHVAISYFDHLMVQNIRHHIIQQMKRCKIFGTILSGGSSPFLNNWMLCLFSVTFLENSGFQKKTSKMIITEVSYF